MGLARQVLDFVFPPCCPVCQRSSAPSSLCDSCADQIRPVRSPLCPVCGVPFRGPGSDHRCAHCLTRRPRYAQARACVLYQSGDLANPLAKALHRYKYERDVTLARILGRLLTAHCPLAVTHDVLIPVPLHLERLRWRGFNQSLLLAKPLARHWSARLDPFALVRTRATVPQVGLDESARRRNIAGAFALRHPAAVRNRTVLLVDDVYTTGATVDECARVLRRAGARRVDVLVLARAVLQ